MTEETEKAKDKHELQTEGFLPKTTKRSLPPSPLPSPYVSHPPSSPDLSPTYIGIEDSNLDFSQSVRVHNSDRKSSSQILDLPHDESEREDLSPLLCSSLPSLSLSDSAPKDDDDDSQRLSGLSTAPSSLSLRPVPPPSSLSLPLDQSSLLTPSRERTQIVSRETLTAFEPFSDHSFSFDQQLEEEEEEEREREREKEREEREKKALFGVMVGVASERRGMRIEGESDVREYSDETQKDEQMAHFFLPHTRAHSPTHKHARTSTDGHSTTHTHVRSHKPNVSPTSLRQTSPRLPSPILAIDPPPSSSPSSSPSLSSLAPSLSWKFSRPKRRGNDEVTGKGEVKEREKGEERENQAIDSGDSRRRKEEGEEEVGGKKVGNGKVMGNGVREGGKRKRTEKGRKCVSERGER